MRQSKSQRKLICLPQAECYNSPALTTSRIAFDDRDYDFRSACLPRSNRRHTQWIGCDCYRFGQNSTALSNGNGNTHFGTKGQTDMSATLRPEMPSSLKSESTQALCESRPMRTVPHMCQELARWLLIEAFGTSASAHDEVVECSPVWHRSCHLQANPIVGQFSSATLGLPANASSL